AECIVAREKIPICALCVLLSPRLHSMTGPPTKKKLNERRLLNGAMIAATCGPVEGLPKMSNRSQGNGRGGGMLFSPEDFTPKKSSRQYKRMRDANKSKSKQERLDKWGGKTRWEKTTGM
ncbi:unnamed protein product, partial [Heterosigma akashiwo]